MEKAEEDILQQNNQQDCITCIQLLLYGHHVFSQHCRICYSYDTPEEQEKIIEINDQGQIFEIGSSKQNNEIDEEELDVLLINDNVKNKQQVKKQLEEKQIDNDDIFDDLDLDSDNDDAELNVYEKQMRTIRMLERFKNCPCCMGMIWNCKGAICQTLGECYCIAQARIEKQM